MLENAKIRICTNFNNNDKMIIKKKVRNKNKKSDSDNSIS